MARYAAVILGVLLAGLPARGMDLPGNSLWVESLDLSKAFQDFEKPMRGKSILNKPIKLKGTEYEHGIGAHARSIITIDLKGAATRFASYVGVDDEAKEKGSVNFEVWVDGKKMAESGILKGNGTPRLLEVELTGAKKLVLKVDDAGDHIAKDYADWAEAYITLASGTASRPEVIATAPLPPLPPPPLPTPDVASVIYVGTAAIHGTKVVGMTPGRPFLYSMPTTGDEPFKYSSKNLPAGLSIEEETGYITGTVKAAGNTLSDIAVKGTGATSTRKLMFIAGADKQARTPMQGWSSKYALGNKVDDAAFRKGTDWFVKSELTERGYGYALLDGPWMGPRAADGKLSGSAGFPDMAALGEFVHKKGMRFGLSLKEEASADVGSIQGAAKSFAEWSVDLVLYDFSAVPLTRRGALIQAMRFALEKTGRDIVLWDAGAPGASVELSGQGSHASRLKGDMPLTWEDVKAVTAAARSAEKFSAAGHWNDVGYLGVGKFAEGETRLAPAEQHWHVTLAAITGAPMFVSCDAGKLSDLSTRLLANDELNNINQDPLGLAPKTIRAKDPVTIIARPLYDSTIAVAMFNSSEQMVKVPLTWKDLGLNGTLPVHDVWMRKGAGDKKDGMEQAIEPHGALLFRVGKPQPPKFIVEAK